MTPARLDPQRSFELIDAYTERLLALAAESLEPAVPCCPGWTVRDVVEHVANVYEHKVRVMADNAWPDPWPAVDQVDVPPLVALSDAKAHLFEEFAEHRLDETTTTFSADDDTIAFWVRRMLLEIAVHCYDVELAHGDVTSIPDDVALDGIDEVLKVMLAGPWWAQSVATRHPVGASVAVTSGEQAWVCQVEAKQVSVSDGGGDVAGTVSGDPMAVFLWLWGRVGHDQVTIAGDESVVAEFRARLAECTG